MINNAQSISDFFIDNRDSVCQTRIWPGRVQFEVSELCDLWTFEFDVTAISSNLT